MPKSNSRTLARIIKMNATRWISDCKPQYPFPRAIQKPRSRRRRTQWSNRNAPQKLDSNEISMPDAYIDDSTSSKLPPSPNPNKVWSPKTPNTPPKKNSLKLDNLKVALPTNTPTVEQYTLPTVAECSHPLTPSEIKASFSLLTNGTILFHAFPYPNPLLSQPNPLLSQPSPPPSPAANNNPNSSNGATHYRPLCLAPDCPVQGLHYEGLYIHEGRTRTRSERFGASNPPPEIWAAVHRMLVMAKGKGGFLRDLDLVRGFVRYHFV